MTEAVDSDRYQHIQLIGTPHKPPIIGFIMTEAVDSSENIDEVQLPEKGTGVFIFVDGSRYDGEWMMENGKRLRHGFGKFVDGPETYEGQWDHDQMHGEGKMIFATGATYEGFFDKNVFHGEGMYTWADGSSYTGGWRENKMHGEGCFIDSEKIEWKGQFYNGKFNNGRSYLMLK
eukprot:CAMPEP_0117872494 /NCGR_PEP_ID=MMETSP0950-20121206/11114_1 /TAXON_ID=44440 /ORGANISM="Chattonella subsalsa, Strain CCMP2191" /LENGTH=174 /DNA_ID=CAMNT_0005725273 /DNA_START=211 /DNA_END=735 /DNA_ORIENTATION=-